MFLVLAAALVAGTAVSATTMQDPTLAALLNEVRLLREAMERSGVATARIQLLSGRAALQEQRVARLRSEVQGLDREVGTLGAERTRQQQVAAEIERALESEGDAARRTALEQELTQIRLQVRHSEAMLEDARARRTQAVQSFDVERGRYEDIEARLDELDRELARAVRR